MRQSLFLYGIHFILVRVFNKAGALVLGRVLDRTAMAVLAVVWFLLLPAAVVASSYAAARILVPVCASRVADLFRRAEPGRRLPKNETEGNDR